MTGAAAMLPEARAALMRGRQLFEAGDDAGSLAAFERVLAAGPGYADVHYYVGLVHERGGRLEEARAAFERALEINPAYAECALALGSVYERSGEFERAQAIAERARAAGVPALEALDGTTRGKLANLHAALGDAYRESGDLRAAIGEYRKALDRAPGFLDIRCRLGAVYREVGLGAQSVAELRRALRANPAYSDAGVQLGLTYFTLGRTDEAIAEWNAVLARDASREDVRMYLRMTQRKPGG
jgi:tetratricopeptide (TPR) repeat protein